MEGDIMAQQSMTTFRRMMSTGSLKGDDIYNPRGEKLGKVEEIMLDVTTGMVGYVVLSFGGFMGMGDKLFAVPWQALRLDEEQHRFILDVPKDRLESAPGFDKDNWPDMGGEGFDDEIYAFWGIKTTPRVM
jgi:sporulation protein YlmC with PRC-barrel domain